MKDRAYARNLRERFGVLPHSFQRTAQTSVWLHAVSVGEVLSSVELIRRLRDAMPWAAVYVSTTTLPGRAAADERLQGLVEGVFYAPFDYVFAVRGVLRRIRPLLVVVLETEIWPNLYHESKRCGAGLVVVNGRMSSKTAVTYARLRFLFAEVLSLPDRILVQGEESLRHFLAAGAEAHRVSLGGNLKYDFAPRTGGVAPELQNYFEARRGTPVWMAASTVAPEAPGDPDEDDVVIDAFKRLTVSLPDLTLVLVPRKPERFEAAAVKLETAGVPYVRRSALAGNGSAPPALLLDSIGELGLLFQFASVVFMGGTLPHRGGHNILEPALYAKPIVMGPHMENFPEIIERFRAAGAVREIGSAGELACAVGELLRDPEKADELGKRAAACAESQRGAVARAVSTLALEYDKSIPKAIPYGPLRPVLWLQAQIWRAGGAVKRSRDLKGQVRVGTPVISVGGLAVGGTGKTPMVRWLAARLTEDDARICILTRGYRRHSTDPHTLVPPGGQASVALTGDEAQMFVRDGMAALGIGPNRAHTALTAEREFHPDVFLLDDGFQHTRLARNLDIVLLDGLDPLAGSALIPYGRLREPVSALQRAGGIVITRSEPGRQYTGIRAVVRQHNPDVPVFRSRVVPEAWVAIDGGDVLAPDSLLHERAAAFCGLGNPGGFWRTLEQMGLSLRFRWAFGDHHRYTGAELAQLVRRARATGVSVLLTTEKDAINFPLNTSFHGVRVYWLKIGLEIEDAEALVRVVKNRIKMPS